MNKSHILCGCIGILSLTSCFKDEAPNAECDITQAWLHADDPSEMFYQASDSNVGISDVVLPRAEFGGGVRGADARTQQLTHASRAASGTECDLMYSHR